jgi:CheY-like chemotaxis protein
MNQPLSEFGDILVVDDEASVVEVVSLYLKREGFSVRVARDGRSALTAIQTQLPALVVLDLMVPEIDGLEMMRRLRDSPTTDIPVIMLTARQQETDRIYGLELGADDYVTKPFDIEELKLRVEGSIRRSMREALTHPVTNLPAGKLIEDQLKQVKDMTDPWALLYFGIRNVDDFKEVVGFSHVNEILIFLADIIRETVEAYGTMNDFIGQASDNDFILITAPEKSRVICKTVTERFDEESKVFYNFKDREAGKLNYVDIDGVNKVADFMKIAVGIVSSNQGPFADILQITEDAAENRRRGSGCI